MNKVDRRISELLEGVADAWGMDRGILAIASLVRDEAERSHANPEELMEGLIAIAKMGKPPGVDIPDALALLGALVRSREEPREICVDRAAQSLKDVTGFLKKTGVAGADAGKRLADAMKEGL